MDIILFIILAIPIIIFLFRLKSLKSLGAAGEARVANQLKELNQDEYIVLNDIYIKTEKGSSQIDHIVVSIYGIFVIETKNFNGWIFGKENSEYWTQVIYKRKSRFRNPVKQNWAHVFALKEVLSEYNQINYHPIIVFHGRGELRGIESKIPVIYDCDILYYIRERYITTNLSIEQVRNIAERLNELNCIDKNARKEHIYHVKNNISQQREKIESLVCPRCNGNLVVRNGKNGRFYGCSNYPKCKFTCN